MNEKNYEPGWVRYTARNGAREIKRSVRLSAVNVIAVALKCGDPDVCLDIFGDSHEFEPGSDWDRLAGWSFHLYDLHRLGVDIVVEYLTDAESSAENRRTPTCDCACHRPGVVMMHCVPCC